MSLIEFKNVSFSYPQFDSEESLAVNDLSFSINEGEFVALVGHNGSGKSTAAKLANGLLLPKSGEILIDGMSTSDEKNLFDIRKTLGVVFQNPDNQMIATIIEDDIAFGPENLGLKPKLISERVDWALGLVGMSGHRKGTPFRLSGGQKQRIAIAGVLAIKPRVVIFDEATAMLDPLGRAEIMRVIQDLRQKENTTVVMITHFMDEASLADRIIVLNKGEKLLDGGKEILLKADELEKIGLDTPPAVSLALKLKNEGIELAESDMLDADKLVEAISAKSKKTNYEPKIENVEAQKITQANNEQKPVIDVGNLSFVYSKNSPYQKTALNDINLSVFEGDFLAIIGHTGSGKSTLINHFNALTRIQSGKISVLDMDLSAKRLDFKALRAKVGMVFQYPEYQLFDLTVERDVGFGPRNLKLDDSEIALRVKEAISLVGLDYDSVFDRSPFELSGGQRRRVALAGVLAMRPKILVLDEPTAGLDPRGKTEILQLIKNVQKRMCPTIIMISHNMDEVARYADRIAVMAEGELKAVVTPKELFGEAKMLKKYNILPPFATRIALALNEKGVNIPLSVTNEDELFEELKASLKGGNANA